MNPSTGPMCITDGGVTTWCTCGLRAPSLVHGDGCPFDAANVSRLRNECEMLRGAWNVKEEERRIQRDAAMQLRADLAALYAAVGAHDSGHPACVRARLVLGLEDDHDRACLAREALQYWTGRIR